MKITSYCAMFDRAKRWVLLLLIFAGIAAWQAGWAVSVAAQAKTQVNPADGLTYVWIPPGTFQMGCSANDSDCPISDTPAHSVTITKGFWIGQTPVTQAAYRKVVGGNPSNVQGDRLPVGALSWDKAKAYCEGVKMRLPTEAEWEYAARGGSTAARYGQLAMIAWYGANSGGRSHEVGQKQANGYGLSDMLGNVWEWVADWYGPYDGASAVDPQGPPKGDFRVMRGGSWDSDASLVSVSLRLWSEPGDRNSNIFGVRCAGN